MGNKLTETSAVLISGLSFNFLNARVSEHHMLTFESDFSPRADDHECSWIGWSSESSAAQAFTVETTEASGGKGNHTGE